MNEQGEWVPGQINFTAEAKPDQVGSGLRAINTLFHEGGHAAHFANVAQNAPCFSQEYAPTSMAYAETQSMFCDSLLGDADWLKRYARNAQGEAIPDALIRDRVASSQPMRAFDERSIAVVPYFEAALYQLADAALTPEAVLALARETEVRVLGIESPRPMLAIPHLLNQESAASYQGYLLAHMAVYQTRAFFLRRDGYLTDNGAIGPGAGRALLGARQQRRSRGHAAQPHRRGLLGPLPGGGVQPVGRRRPGPRLEATMAAAASARVSRRGGRDARRAHPRRAWRRGAGRLQRGRRRDVRPLRSVGARALPGGGALKRRPLSRRFGSAAGRRSGMIDLPWRTTRLTARPGDGCAPSTTG